MQVPNPGFGLLTLFVSIALAPAAAAEEWPNFLGPNHDGISQEKGLQTAWSEPLALLWERSVGDSFSGLSCVNGRLYTCGTQDGRQVVLCLNADNGEVIWQTPIEAAYWEPQGGNGTRATPTVDGNRVYVLGALGRLVCLDSDTGKVVWEKKYDAKPQWGYSGSVLIEGNLAIVSPGGKAGGLAAYDKATGAEKWSAGKDGPGYATPYPFTFEGQRYIVGFLAKSAIIVTPEGREVWKEPWITDWDVNAASPVFSDGYLLLTTGYDTGTALFKLTKAGDGLKGEKVWGIDHVLLSKFQTPILHQGHLYGCDQRKLACVEFLTGKEKWKEPRMANGTVVLADGYMYILSESGQLIIAPATPEGFKPTTRADILDDRCWTIPTLYNGRIYARNLSTIKVFKLTK